MMKFLQRSRLDAQGNGHLDGLAEIKGLEGGLLRHSGVSGTEIAHDAAQIAAQLGARYIVPNIEPPQRLRQLRPVARRQGPLGKIIGKTFSEKVMPVQTLESVIKNRSIA